MQVEDVEGEVRLNVHLRELLRSMFTSFLNDSGYAGLYLMNFEGDSIIACDRTVNIVDSAQLTKMVGSGLKVFTNTKKFCVSYDSYKFVVLPLEDSPLLPTGGVLIFQLDAGVRSYSRLISNFARQVNLLLSISK